MKTFAIGDIHGHYDQMMKLMDQLPIEEDDVVVFLGDYVDGGPDTKKVVDQLMAWEEEYPNWVFLYGNHEDLMLDALLYNSKIYGDFYLWWNQGGRETAESYKTDIKDDYQRSLATAQDVIPADHLAWLQARPLFWTDDNYFFVHAGVRPEISLAEYELFYREHQQDMLWLREQFIDSDYDWGKKIIFGHTVFPYYYWTSSGRKTVGSYGKPLVMDNKIGIDGMHHNDGALIAVELPELFSSKAPKFYYEASN